MDTNDDLRDAMGAGSVGALPLVAVIGGEGAAPLGASHGLLNTALLGGPGGGAAGDDGEGPLGFSASPLSLQDLMRGPPSSGSYTDYLSAYQRYVNNQLRGGAGPSTTKESKAEQDAAKALAEENEKKLAKIYEGFQFQPLWDKLSEALTRLEDDPSAAQVLLPLIEVSQSET